ncbi:MAG TPA: metal ABC transporter ATP-binding protein [Thermoprotei archaeon]|nr:metal ABC transporter ATP-binding protein [Thermoprotei archaeon]
MFGGGEMYCIDVKNVSVMYDSQKVLDNISFKVEYPEFVTIIGPNGAGKTTLLKTIAGIIKPITGIVKIFDINIHEDPGEARKYIGYVPQKERISVNLPIKVKDVVLMGLLAKMSPPRITTRKMIEKVRKALERVNAIELFNKRFNELSGGQQQKILIARAIVSDPKILILDEPFSGVDVESQGEIISFLDELKTKNKVSILLVTHDINPIVSFTDKVLLLKNKLIAYGSPSEVIRDEILFKVYGKCAKVIERGGVCYAITGDIHA